MKNEVEEKALSFLKEHKKGFISSYTHGIEMVEPKVAVFTAGMSGAGKTEYAQDRKNKEPYLLHIDTDDIRNFFKPVGYDGQNADLFQKPASKGVHKLFDESVKRGYSIILDSNFADFDLAQKNIIRLLAKGYLISINYIYNTPKLCAEYASIRESVTNRKVPLEVVFESLQKSFETTLMIKDLFGDSIVLNLFHREHNKEYGNISSEEFFTILENGMEAVSDEQ